MAVASHLAGGVAFSVLVSMLVYLHGTCFDILGTKIGAAHKQGIL